MATVAVRPPPRLVAGQLSAADMQAVSDWIRLYGQRFRVGSGHSPEAGRWTEKAHTIDL
jgi:hypothetical protein